MAAAVAPAVAPCAAAEWGDRLVAAIESAKRDGPVAEKEAAAARAACVLDEATAAGAPAADVLVVASVFPALGWYGAALRPLSTAAFYASTPCLRLLLVRGAELNWADRHGRTALTHAAQHDAAGDATAFLASQPGVALDVQVIGGSTALHFASHFGNHASLLALLAAGADPTIASNDGETPLQSAAGADKHAILATLRAAEAWWRRRDAVRAWTVAV